MCQDAVQILRKKHILVGFGGIQHNMLRELLNGYLGEL